MSEQPPASPQSTTLRERAEKAFREMLDNSPENLDALSPETLRTSLHELRVHQIELEMQNEDLLRAQADLGATRARYFDLYDLAPVGYCTVSEKGLILEANLTAATLLHQKRDTLVGRGLSAFISKEDQELYYLCRKKLLDTRQPQECDLRMVRPDDTAFFAHLKITYACDENEEPVCHIALIDITGVKELENTLRESEMHFRTLADSGQALIWTSGIDKKCNYFNRVWLDFTGRSLEQELGDGWAEGVHPDDLDSCFRTYVEAFTRRAPFSMDYRLRRHDGEYRWLEDQGTPRHNNDGEFLGYIGHCLDITDRKQAEMMHRESEARYAQLAEQSLTVAWEVDAQGLYTYVSQVSETVCGYRPDELVGRKHFYDLHPESEREEFKASAFAVFARKQPFVNLVNAIQTKDGRQVWVSTNGSPILNAEGTLCGYRGSDTDITERKEMDANLLEALDRAETANRAKSEFLGVMSHELRTPLNGVLGFAQLLADTRLDSEQKTYAETISSSGEHLLAIVNDILDFSSIDAGTLAIHVAPLAVADLVKTAEDPVRKTAAEKGIELRCELAAGLPEQIVGDAHRIRQILINLLGNAVKFTSDGSVSLRVTRSGQGASRSCEAHQSLGSQTVEAASCRLPESPKRQDAASTNSPDQPRSPKGSFLDFCVEDTGIGISSEELGRLFQPFVQADSKSNRRFGGTGLGLAISRRIAEAMGGAITVASTPGKGSTFTFRFPLESLRAGGNGSGPSHISDRGKSGLTEHRPPVPTGLSPLPAEGGIVLVVEDDRGSRMLAGKMLEALGLLPEFAADGEGALQAFVPEKYFAILMDMSMPVMDGLEATEKIRKVEAAAGSHVPIIALTANVMTGDRERCLAAGMDDFLSKPFKKDELAAKLANFANR